MGLIKCKECGYDVSTSAKVCPHCGVSLKSKDIGCFGCFGCLGVLAFILFVIFISIDIPRFSDLVDDAREKREKNIVDTPDSAATIPSPAPKGKYDPIAKYGKEKVDSANKVMDLVKQDCNVFIDGGLVVEMSYYVNDKNVLLGYVTAIANADAILFGSARSIFVYDPSKKMIASADALRGIRLRD